MILLEEDRLYGVERQTRGIGADLLQKSLRSHLPHDEDRGVNLGDRLYPEPRIGIADLDQLAVAQAYADAEEIRVDIVEEGDVVRIVPTIGVLIGQIGLLDGLSQH